MSDRDPSNFLSTAGDTPLAMLYKVIDSIEDGAAIYDANDCLVHFNPSYFRYFKLVEDIVRPGVSFRQIFEAQAERGMYQGAQAGRAGWVENRIALFQSGAKKNEFQRLGGRWASVDYYKLSGGGTFVVTADITDRKVMEESLRKAENETRELNQKLEQRVEERTRELQKSEALFKAVVNNSPTKIHIKDLNGRYTLINREAEKLFGVTDAEGRGKTTDHLFSRDMASVFLAHDQAVLESGEAIEAEEVFPLAEGVRTFLTTKFPIFDQGRISGIGAIGIDITERKQTQNALIIAKEEAEAANRSKSEFLAVMSHDLRTPLNAIIGFAEIISQQYFGLVDARYQGYARDIESSGQFLLSLINDILDLSAIESGKQPIVREAISISEIVGECETIIRDKAHRAGIELQMTVADDLPSLFADRRATVQILLNLLSNAVRFTPSGGRISLRAGVTGNGHAITVQDTGRGIAADKIATVTDPFIKGETDPHKTQKSTGLGLAIVKSLVGLHGGSLDIKSTLGQGTCVTVTFPT